MRSMGACYWWSLFLICTVLFPGVWNLFSCHQFFLGGLMHVYPFLTANIVSEPGYGANKKERQTVL
jgi:hypothetical protein